METKICNKCKQEKICDLFGKHKQRLDGLRSVCNECRKIESKKYLEKNSEKRKETISKYYRNNTEAWKKYAKKMMETNHEKLKEIKNKSYHKNKEKHNLNDGMMSHGISWLWTKWANKNNIDTNKYAALLNIKPSVADHVNGGGINGYIVQEGQTFVSSPSLNTL